MLLLLFAPVKKGNLWCLLFQDIVLKAGKLLLANPHGKSNVPEGVQMKVG